MRRITRRRGSGSSCARAIPPSGSSSRSSSGPSASSESSSSGEPPSRVTASATRSGWVAPIGGRSSLDVDHVAGQQVRRGAQAVDRARAASSSASRAYSADQRGSAAG